IISSITILPPPLSSLFPYTTLFRSIISFVDSSQDLVDKEQADLTDKSEADDSQESPASDNEDQQLEQPDIEETSEPDDEAQLEDEIPDSFPDEENEEEIGRASCRERVWIKVVDDDEIE